METRHSDNDGSDIFWPGYVDAVTNLVLNLLFLLTIMTVAVFMFALELGRASKGGPENPQAASTKQNAAAAPKSATDPVTENIALKREIERLNMKLAQQVSQNVQAGGLAKSVDVTSAVPKPLSGLDKTLASDFEIRVNFKDEAVAFTPAEHDRLLESLKPIVAREKTTIYVEVPPGFSEAKRMGFYRAMAVRNILIEMKIPKERIDISVREGKNNANASLVRVRAR
ncbi:MAG: hypothetical protein WA003_17745 [Desulfuromonadaceae bacterium]